MQIDTVLSAPLADAGTQAQEFAALGFDGVYTFENAHDVFFPLLEAARHTELFVYPNVAIAFPRSPMHLAHAAWDLQQLAQGRFALGLGTQVKPHIERRYAATWTAPVARMREMIEAIKAVFRCWQDGEPLDFHGDHYTLTLMTVAFDPGPLPWGPPPIWVGALGPQMTRMVAAHADGLLVHPFHTEAFLREHTLPLMDEGFARAGRTRDGFHLGIDTIVCAGRTDEEQAVADTGARWLLAFYGSTPAYRPVLDLLGRGDLQPELNRLSKLGQWDEMAASIDEDLLDAITLRGDPDQVAAELHRRYDGVADRVALTLPYAADASLLGDTLDAIRR